MPDRAQAEITTGIQVPVAVVAKLGSSQRGFKVRASPLPDRTDARGDHSRATAVLVFVQNKSPSMNL